ncbi:hypothetical protein RB7363 [Rhodopirellula baltica SH 1]|uniref:Uncharacterized protein n=1 Tax=Rhodopirellula baltica (strain DSM 10527 / NCIMB 13988 / SH1) TaxID=243090 RepID=Q7UNU8_RHOBA|nr:hypothetical protein RB7363 [Rhodopirellula baltica SH 1]
MTGGIISTNPQQRKLISRKLHKNAQAATMVAPRTGSGKDQIWRRLREDERYKPPQNTARTNTTSSRKYWFPLLHNRQDGYPVEDLKTTLRRMDFHAQAGSYDTLVPQSDAHHRSSSDSFRCLSRNEKFQPGHLRRA